ncbi:MAG: phosphate ABC transporter substrate-binding protein [Symploca sp. SIO2C1]|nr:phosphate ABC transporter substrate-binding protein [Symploca sp. SIO2C1]
MKLNTLLIVVLTSVLSVSCTPNTNNDNPPGVQPAQQEIKITGAATPYPAMKALAVAYEGKTKISFLPSSQSASGIGGVKNELAEIGTVTRKLKPEENDGSLVYREFARDALVVATHSSVEGVTNLATEDLKAIYSGAVTNWQDVGGQNATIVVLDRPEDESAKRLLRQHYLGKELKNAPDAVILRHEKELIATIRDTPYSIGAFSLASALANQLPVNHLRLNGVEPTSENVQLGKYPMVRTLALVWSTTASDSTQKFLDFAFSEAGAKHLLNSGFVPSRTAIE